MPPSFRFLLTLIAVTSPLLSFASLWQIKEWRIDRVREHLRTEGLLRQLFGVIRPLIFLSALSASVSGATELWDAALSALAVVSVVQILRRRRFPVWTAKAVTLTGTAFALNVIIAAMMFRTVPQMRWISVALPLLQPGLLVLAWIAFRPLDALLKRRVMERAAALRARYPHATVIGITGSVGKTTTKELITHALVGKAVLSTPAYVNSEMGVSQWLLRELPEHPKEAELILIVEMGAYRPGEIRTLCAITEPVMGVITFIGTQHVALFGSQEKLCAAKAELLESLPENGRAFLNGDNATCSSLKDRCRCTVTIVGTGGHADIEAFDIEETGKGMAFRVGETSFSVPLRGTHNVANVLLAVAVAEALGMKRGAIAERLRTYRPPHHTFTVRSERGVTVLDDTHNASPESFRAAIAWAKSQPSERKILVTPGVIELGAEEGAIHRELGAQAAPVFDRVIFAAKHGSQMFAEGFGKPVEILGRNTQRVSGGDLLVCVGRMSTETINELLP